jgi:hypothetical protein
LLSYLKAKSSDSPRWVDELWPFMFFCLSIAAKPMAVTLPVIMLLLDIAPLKRATSLPALLKLVLEKLHYFVITIIVILVTLTTQSIAMPDTGSLPVWARALNAIDNSWFYLQHYLWPVNLSPFYPYPQDASYLSSWQFWLPGTIFLVITSVVTMALLSRKNVWPFVLFSFYIVTLLPVSGLIHVGPAKATDHYVYLATLPLTLLTALIIVSAWNKSGVARIIATVFSTVYLVFLLLITQVQVSVWNNPLSLWTRVTSLYPADPFGHRNLAAAYVQVGDWDKALMHAELSLRFGSPDKDYVTRLRQEIDRINTDTGIEEK